MSFAARVERLKREYGRSAMNGLTAHVAADVINGGAPRHARAFDRRGVLVGVSNRICADEDFAAFRGRTRGWAQGLAGAARLVIGGVGEANPVSGLSGLPRGAVTLPDIPLHPSQREAVALIETNRRVCLVCGRRWGKSTVIVTLAVDYALSGRSVAIFAPTFRFLKPLFAATALALGHLPGVSINRATPDIELAGGGRVDFWSVDVTQRAGRGKGYHLVLVDEAAHDENNYLAGTLEAAIAPATLDYSGRIVLASTPNGLEGAFWECATVSEKGYVTHHAPTSANPHLPAEEIAYLRSTLRAEIASQELDALFLDTSGASIFPLSMLLDAAGQPHPDDFQCDCVGLTIDSNSGKGGEGRDGAAACIFAVTLPNILRGSLAGARVVLLDWDIVSLSQGHVADWIQRVRGLGMSWFQRLRPLRGLPAAHVEPAGNGPSVIEVCRSQGLNPQEVDMALVALGKDNRALRAEPHVSDGRVKIGKTALEKRTNYRGVTANHLVRQVTGFKTFDREAYKREDDLLDAAVYSILLSLGDGTEAQWSRLKRPALAAE
jgi:hypothetical protein